MFELIGLAFATLILFALAAVGGALYAGIAWLLLRKSGRSTPKRPIILAAQLPIVCAVYFCLFHLGYCAFVTSAHESVFGDISEPLPNGYTLIGLAKMSDYSNIDVPLRMRRQTGPPADVGKVAVEDQLIFASISRPFGEPEHPNDQRGFFALNTVTGEVERFDTLSQMEVFAGHPINLVPSGIFRTQDKTTLHIRNVGTVLLLGLPLLVLLLYAAYLIRLRSSQNESIAAA